MILRAITNTGPPAAPLTDVNGNILADAVIRFTLVNSRSYTAGTFDATTGEPVSPGPYIGITDAAGLFSVDLWPTSRGLEERFYLVEIGGDDGSNFPPFKAQLTDSVQPLPFLSFRLGGDTVQPWETGAFTAHVENTAIHTPAGTGHTHDNKTILDGLTAEEGQLKYAGTEIGGGSSFIDGGNASSLYTSSQIIDGGHA